MLYRFTEGLPSNPKALTPLTERRQGALLLRLYGPKTHWGTSRPRNENRLPLFHTSEKVFKTVLRFSKRDLSHASMECCLDNRGVTYEKTLTMLRTSIPIRLFPLTQHPTHKRPIRPYTSSRPGSHAFHAHALHSRAPALSSNFLNRPIHVVGEAEPTTDVPPIAPRPTAPAIRAFLCRYDNSPSSRRTRR